MKGKNSEARPCLAGSSWLKMAVLLVLVTMLLSLAGCGTAATPVPTKVEPQAATPTNTAAPTETPLPTATATAAPTATPEPTATDEPTATPIPALGVLDGGFDVWCAPQSYAGTKPTGPDAPDYARRLTITNDKLEVRIPASFCVLDVQFNQPVPEGTQLYFYDANTPFLKLPMTPAEDRPDLAWASVVHPYVINPPLWEISYRVAVMAPDGKELWSSPVKFAKALPEECLYGGLPDPVTLWCTITDPWEIEPWPDVTYPYDRSKFPTPSQ